MKIKILFLAAFLFLTLCSVSYAGESNIEILAGGINLTGNLIANPTGATDLTVVDFAGFKLFGDVVKEKRGENTIFIINHGAGFIFPKEHPAGMLRIVAEKPSRSARAVFAEYPYELEHSDVQLDGIPIVLQIAADSVFVYMDIKEGDRLILSSATFLQDEQTGGAGTNNGIQIGLKPKFILPSSMETLVQKVNP